MKVGAGKGFSIGAVQKFTMQLLQGPRHLKQLQVIHADLKPDNILVDDTSQNVKIGAPWTWR